MPTAKSKLRRVKCKHFIGEFLVGKDLNKNLSSFCAPLVFPVSSTVASSVIAAKSHSLILQSNEPETISYRIYYIRKFKKTLSITII